MLSSLDFKDRPQPRAFTSREADPFGVLRHVFEGAPHGVLVAAEDGAILFVNAPASAIFAYSSDELIGQPFSRLLPGPASATDDSQWTEILRVVQSGTMISGRTVAGTRKDGVMVPLEIGFNLLADGAGRFVIASVIDITERLSLEARLADANNAYLGQ